MPAARRTKPRARASFWSAIFPKAKVFTAEDPGCPILGDRGFADVWHAHLRGQETAPVGIVARPPKARQLPQSKSAAWPELATPLTLTLGKGGVGKTTISAGLAFHHRQVAKSERWPCARLTLPHRSTMSLARRLETRCRPVLRDRKLLAMEIDAMAEFQQWTGQMRRQLNDAMTGEQRGIHLDVSLDRKFLLALLDVVPPGVDEIFAIFRIVDLLQTGGRVVIDMAPTGHALEVLRTPARMLAWARVLLKTLAAHRTLPIARDVAVEVATLSQNVRELAAILRDRKRCRLAVVTLPEPLPDYETQRLLQGLKELNAPLGAVFVNRVLIGDAGVRAMQVGGAVAGIVTGEFAKANAREGRFSWRRNSKSRYLDAKGCSN